MTDKSGWCPLCTANRHKECNERAGVFWRGGKKRTCACPHPRQDISAGERARENQALRLHRVAEFEQSLIKRRLEISAQVGMPPDLLQNNRKTLKVQVRDGEIVG